MKPDAGTERAKGGAQHQKLSSAAKGSRRASPAAPASMLETGQVVQLGRMSHAELMSLAERHNKQIGLAGDVMASVMRGVADIATVRPPAVHPFTVGGAPRKDEYQAAWKSLAKRTGVPLMLSGEGQQTAAAAAGIIVSRANRQASAAATAVGAVAVAAAAAEAAAAAAKEAALHPPTHAQIYGSVEQPLQQLNFLEALSSWLGVGLIDLPLLAPGAPPLPLRSLFMEVLEAGGSRPQGNSVDGAAPGIAAPGPGSASGRSGGERGASSGGGGGGGGGGSMPWGALALKLVGDEALGDLVRQVYDAYLLPLERRLPRGTKPARVETWMHEDLEGRGLLVEEQLAATAEQVAARLEAARAAILTLEQHQQQQQQQSSRGPSALPADPTTAAAAVAVAVKADAASGVAAAMAAGAVVAIADRTAAADAGLLSPPPSTPQPLQPLQPPPVPPFAAEAMRAMRTAAVAAPTLLPAVIAPGGGSTRAPKRARASSRSGGGKGGKAGARKRARGSGGAAGDIEGQDDGRDGFGGAEAAVAWNAHGGSSVAGGDSRGMMGPDLTDRKASALLCVVASLRELRAGPPSCSIKPPDLRTNFVARWQQLHAERAAAAAAAAAEAMAAAAAVDAANIAAAGAGTDAGVYANAARAAVAGGGGSGSGGGSGGKRDLSSSGEIPPVMKVAWAAEGNDDGDDERLGQHPFMADRTGLGDSRAMEVGDAVDAVVREPEDEERPRLAEGKARGRAGGGAQPRSSSRHAKRQRHMGHKGSTGPVLMTSPSLMTSDLPTPPPPPPQQQLQQLHQQQQQERRKESPRSRNQQAFLPQGQSSRRPKQYGREHQPPPQQQREHSRKRTDDDRRRFSPYVPPPRQGQGQGHRATSSAVPLMSAAAASPYEWRSAAAPVMHHQAHRPLPPPPPPLPPVPLAVQQHLEEMRRQVQHRSHPYNGDGGGGGGGGYYYDRPPPRGVRDAGRFDHGPGGGAVSGPGPGVSGRPYGYPRYPARDGGDGDWDEIGSGGAGGGWGYGGARDVH